MNRKWLIALALLSASANALDLKGVRLGMTPEELKSAFPGGAAAGRPNENGVICYNAADFCAVNVGTIAEIPTQLQVSFLNGKVSDAYSGHLHPSQLDQIVDALKAKYGPPTATSMTKVQNGIGNTFDNPHFVWKFPEGELRVSRFLAGPTSLDYAELRIVSTAWIADEAAKRQKRNADL